MGQGARGEDSAVTRLRARTARAALLGFVSASLALAVSPVLPAHASSDDTTPPDAFDLVADAGEFQTGYSVAAPYTNIYVSWQPATDDQSAVTYEVTVDGLVARVVTDAFGSETITRRVEVPEGSHLVGVTAIDGSGNRRDSTNVLDVVVDKVTPWFTSHPRLMLGTGPVTSEGYPMHYAWSGADKGTGLAEVRIGPNLTCCYTLAPDLTEFDFTVPPRSAVAWRVWLVDGVGRFVKAPRSGYVVPVPWGNTAHSDGWQKEQDSSALDGSEWLSTEPGRRFSLSVAGSSIGWVASTGPRRGRADVIMAGHARRHGCNLYSAHRRPAQVVWAATLPKNEEPVKVTIVNRSPASRPVVGVDAFLLHR